MTTVEIMSVINPPTRVSIDVFGLNPLAEDYRAVNPQTYAMVVRAAGQPPKMFTGGAADLPAFTASGVDPRHLLKLAYGARHYAAALPTAEEFHGLYEQWAGDPYAGFQHQGLEEAITRIKRWLVTMRQEVQR